MQLDFNERQAPLGLAILVPVDPEVRVVSFEEFLSDEPLAPASLIIVTRLDQPTSSSKPKSSASAKISSKASPSARPSSRVSAPASPHAPVDTSVSLARFVMSRLMLARTTIGTNFVNSTVTGSRSGPTLL